MNEEMLEARIQQRTRLAMAHKGWNEPKLAEVMGISRQAVHKYFHKNGKTNSTKLIALSKALDFPLDYFISEDYVYLGVCLFGGKTNFPIKEYWETQRTKPV